MGEWSITLAANTPQDILDQIDYFGHIAITTAPVDPTRYGDALLTDARYAGVLRGRTFTAGDKEISGAGMSFWIADEDGKGHAIEDEIVFTGADFTTVITTLLPPTVTIGTINPLTGLHNNKYKLTSRRDALNYVAGLYSAEWRVNGDATFDIGTVAQMYPVDPTCAIIRRLPEGGIDTDGVRALPGNSEVDADVEDFSTRVVTVGEGDGLTVAVGTADIDSEKNPYKDLQGNALKMTRLVSEQNTSLINADARAQLQLDQFDTPREEIKLSTLTHDVKGDLSVGGNVWVEDEDAKLVDLENNVNFKGMRINPVKLRVTELQWPVEAGMGVAYRHWNGTWIDLTPYVMWETGEVAITVGGYNRSLTGSTSPNDPITGGGTADTSTPRTPVFTTPFVNRNYQSPVNGFTRAEVVVAWEQPLNDDDTVIADGGEYQIRYRTGEVGIWVKSNDELADYDHDQLLGTFDSPVPFLLGDWNNGTVPWGTETLLLQDLEPGIPYDFQIRALDNALPPHASEWSPTEIIQTRPDTVAPEPPAAAEIAASKVAIQLKHFLGQAGTGGTFNLAADLHHLNVYDSYEPTFECDTVNGTNKVGSVLANVGMMLAETPVIATFQVSDPGSRWYKVTAVDHYGNESRPSVAVQQTAELWDSAYISELTVSKVSAGSILSNWIIAAEMATATTGSRVRIGYYGIELYDQGNNITLDANTSDGSVYMIGTLSSGREGRRITISGDDNEIQFFPELGETRFGRLYSYIPSNFPNDVAIEVRAIDSDTTTYTARYYQLPNQQAMAFSPKGEGGDTLSSSAITVFSNSAYIDINEILGTAPSQTENAKALVQVEEDNITIQMQEGADRFGGFLWLTSGYGSSFFGQKTDVNDKWISFQDVYTWWQNSSNDYIRISSQRMEMVVGGEYGLLVRNPSASLGPFIEATRYCGINEGAFFGQVLNHSGGFFFSVQDRENPSGSGNFEPTPVLQLDGTSARFVKNFIIDHPDDVSKFLVHGCTESPVAGIEYWGEAWIRNGFARVRLPKYFEGIATPYNRQVQVTPVTELCMVSASEIENGAFTIRCSGPDGTKVKWLAKAERKDAEFPVEPDRSEYHRRGSGPYTWLEKKRA